MTIDLFAPCRIGRLELKNRFVRSATWDATADSSGAVTDTSVALYQNLARGGVGLIVTGYAFISPSGQANHGQYGIHSDAMIPGLTGLVRAAHDGGARIALQIVHAGGVSPFLSRRGITLLAVSKAARISVEHREMTDEDIEGLLNDYVAAALRAREAGFDAVQLHGAHGYGLNQFLSPLFNFRTDRWGGNAENRRRFHLELIRRIRRTMGADFPIMIKFGVQDDAEGGLSLNDGVATAQHMVRAGIDAIEVSRGIGEVKRPPGTDNREWTYYRERAAVKRTVTVPVILVGGIRSLDMANNIVESGDADMIAMSRPFIREPDLIARWRSGNLGPARCTSCYKCHAIVAKGEALECGEERRLREENVGA